MNNLINTILLLVCAVAVAGFGYYVTEVRQPARMQAIDDTIELARLQQAQVSQLLVEQSASQGLASESLARWKARYKEIPEQLNTADMILYLEALTASGFERFDIDLAGNTSKGAFSYYTFRVKATSYFNAMYHFVWHIENNREFYRIRDLKVGYSPVYKTNAVTERPRRYDMVEFSFELDAYYAGHEGMSAPGDSLQPVPRNLLPAHDPAHNSFFPIVRTDLPPNDEMLLDVESATLVSIVGRRAVFSSGGAQYVVGEGDRIYLGNVVSIDPNTAKVRVQLNKGGSLLAYEVQLDIDQLDNARRPGVQMYPVQN